MSLQLRRQRKLERVGHLFGNRKLVRVWKEHAHPSHGPRGIGCLVVIAVLVCIIAAQLIGTVAASLIDRLPPKSLLEPPLAIALMSGWCGLVIGGPIWFALSTKERRLRKFVRKHLGKGYRGRSDLCFACGYDLSHARSLACPECGTRATSHLAELRR